jgi:hypothetical protein
LYDQCAFEHYILDEVQALLVTMVTISHQQALLTCSSRDADVGAMRRKFAYLFISKTVYLQSILS